MSHFRLRGRVVLAVTAAFSTAVVSALAPVVAAAEPGRAGPEQKYLVLFKGTAPDAAAERAIKRAGGTVTEVNRKVGYAYVSSRNTRFTTEVATGGAVEGAVAERVVGRAPQLRRPAARDIERLSQEAKGLKAKAGLADAPAVKAPARTIAPEPLANLQWDMRMIGATPTGSYALNQGKGVRVGIIDTGIDGSHPDIAPNFNKRLSRNFVTDMPDIDGACEVPSCVDPVDVDDDGHGTHVAARSARPSIAWAWPASRRRPR